MKPAANPADGRLTGKRVTVGGVALVAGGAALMSLIGKWEGSAEYVVYADRLANGLPTVCKGLTHHVTSTPIIVGERWSPEKCEAEEQAAVIKVQEQLAKCFTSAPPQSVFDAATSHAWNVGAPSTCKSSAMHAWRQGDWALGCQRLSRSDTGKMVWVYAGGKFVQGLANRRASETDFCMKGVSK